MFCLWAVLCVVYVYELCWSQLATTSWLTKIINAFTECQTTSHVCVLQVHVQNPSQKQLYSSIQEFCFSQHFFFLAIVIVC